MAKPFNRWIKRLLLAMAPAFLTISSSVSGQATTDLVAAAEANDVATVEQLLRTNAPIEARDRRGRTALMAATHANAVDVAHALINAGADVNAVDAIDDSPYLYAAAEGRLEILRMTLNAGANLASVNRYGGTGLTPAAHHGHIETVRTLLATDIDVDQINRLGWTALLEAVILGDGGPVHREIVGALIDAGADRTIADQDGITPLTHAQNSGFDEMVRLLQGNK